MRYRFKSLFIFIYLYKKKNLKIPSLIYLKNNLEEQKVIDGKYPVVAGLRCLCPTNNIILLHNLWIWDWIIDLWSLLSTITNRIFYFRLKIIAKKLWCVFNLTHLPLFNGNCLNSSMATNKYEDWFYELIKIWGFKLIIS